IAKAIADQLRAKLTGREEQEIAAKPTDNVEAYDAYLRGLAYNLKTQTTPANSLGAQKYFRDAVRLDPKFTLAWALLSIVEPSGWIPAMLPCLLCTRLTISVFVVSRKRCGSLSKFSISHRTTWMLLR